ncbi:MAG: class I SAM-dependent methyltransferase [Steroidobacteraceae bacterium]
MKRRLASIPPIFVALLLQVVAVLVVAGLVRVLSIPLEPWLAAVACGVLAATLSGFAGLERWWLPIQLLFVPALWLMLNLSVPAFVYGGLFILLLLVFWSTFRTRVPLYLSSDATWRAIEDLLPPPDAAHPLRIIDLGSGLGGLLVHLATRRPHDQLIGVELAPLPALLSKLRLMRHAHCTVHWGSFWKLNLAEYEMVFAFLSPVPMQELWTKARAEMRPGTLFISSSFEVPGQTPDRVVQVNDSRQTRLLIWKMP